MPKEVRRIVSGVAQATTGQTTTFDVPRWATSAIFNLGVITTAGTTPLTDFKLQYVVPRITAAVACAQTTSGTENEIQTLNLTAGNENDVFKLTADSEESDAITIPAGGFALVTAAQVKAGLLTIDAWSALTADIAVVKTLNAYAISFTGTLAAADIATITVTNPTGAAAGTVTETRKGAVAGNEVQTITMTGGPTHGTWTFSFTGHDADITTVTSRLLAATATAADVNYALNEMLPPGSTYEGKHIVDVRTGSGTTGAPYIHTLTFSGSTVDAQGFDMFTVDGTKLYTYTPETTTNFAGWDGITQIVATTAGEVIVLVGPDEADTADDTGAIYQLQHVLPDKLAAVLTFDRTTGNETYTYSLYATFVGG